MREEEYYRLQKLSKVYGVTLRTAILIASAELDRKYWERSSKIDLLQGVI
ncbi:MAG: hypothetical protein IJ520_01010 [Synergistaceae bacterium]|nr:hypothetical protein [Synergistaceae bacterium]MBR1602380.1 hypothetical protein [Synergistaceae bacterium]